VIREGVSAVICLLAKNSLADSTLIEAPTISRRHTKTRSDNSRRHLDRDCHRSTTTQLCSADCQRHQTILRFLSTVARHKEASSRTLLSDLVYRCVFHWKSTDISEEPVVSIFKVEEEAKKEVSVASTALHYVSKTLSYWKISIFSNMAPCSSLTINRCYCFLRTSFWFLVGSIFSPKDGSVMFLRNVGWISKNTGRYISENSTLLNHSYKDLN
jgi:hypothetical protein